MNEPFLLFLAAMIWIGFWPFLTLMFLGTVGIFILWANGRLAQVMWRVSQYIFFIIAYLWLSSHIWYPPEDQGTEPLVNGLFAFIVTFFATFALVKLMDFTRWLRFKSNALISHIPSVGPKMGVSLRASTEDRWRRAGR